MKDAEDARCGSQTPRLHTCHVGRGLCCEVAFVPGA